MRLKWLAFGALMAAALLSLGPSVPAAAESTSGEVVYINPGCDYFIVRMDGGDFALLEWFGGPTPSVGERVVGEMEQYGFTNIISVVSGASIRVWIDDYWLSREDVAAMYVDRCGSLTQPGPTTPSRRPTTPRTGDESVIRSTIRGEFTGWSGDTIFALDNGQLWQQAAYSYHYHYAYRPRVTIVQTGAGYIMQVEGVSETLRVRRLR
jgi:hypothetical protein